MDSIPCSNEEVIANEVQSEEGEIQMATDEESGVRCMCFVFINPTII